MVVRKEEGLMSDDLGLFDDVEDFLAAQQATQVREEEEEEVEFIDPNEIEEIEDPDVGLTGKPPVTQASDEEDEDGDEDAAVNEDSSLFTPYAKFLVDEGVFSTLNLDEFDGTAEGLKKAMSNELNYHIDSYKKTMPSEIKRLLDGYERGVPFDEMLKITSDRVRYDNIKPEALAENTDLQRKLVKDYLDKTTRLTETMKSKMISQWEDGMELEEQSKVALTELKSFQDQQENEAIARQEAEQKRLEAEATETINKLNKHITSTQEIVPGIKLNQMMKDKIKNNLTVPVEYNEYGYPINKLSKYMQANPIEGEVILNYIFEATNQFTDWSIFSKIGKSQAIKELEAASMVIDSKTKGNNNASRAPKAETRRDLIKGIDRFLQG